MRLDAYDAVHVLRVASGLYLLASTLLTCSVREVLHCSRVWERHSADDVTQCG